MVVARDWCYPNADTVPASVHQAPTKHLLQQSPFLDEAYTICTDLLRDLALNETKYATFARMAYTMFPIITTILYTKGQGYLFNS